MRLPSCVQRVVGGSCRDADLGPPPHGDNNRPIKRPRTIQFGVLSPEEIKAISVCKVEYPETFEEGNAKPVSRICRLASSLSWPCWNCS